MRRPQLTSRTSAAWAVALLAGVGPALAQEQAQQPEPSNTAIAGPADQEDALAGAQAANTEDVLRAELNIWIWLVGLNGDVGLGNRTANVDAGFGDILDASDSLFAFSGRLEVGFGPWGGFVDGTYSKLGADDQTGPLGQANVDVTFDMGMVDFGLMYRLGDWEPSGEAALNPRNMTLDLYAGARYTSLELSLEPANVASRTRSTDWIDPIVGTKFVLPFCEHWCMEVNGDIGGFGVGSDFTWSATAVFGYGFSLFDLPATIYTGYRAIGQDFSEGSGADEFKWDIVQHGPILGFSLLF